MKFNKIWNKKMIRNIIRSFKHYAVLKKEEKKWLYFIISTRFPLWAELNAIKHDLKKNRNQKLFCRKLQKDDSPLLVYLWLAHTAVPNLPFPVRVLGDVRGWEAVGHHVPCGNNLKLAKDKCGTYSTIKTWGRIFQNKTLTWS